MSNERTISPRSLNQSYRNLQDGPAGIMWGADQSAGFGLYILSHRERNNLSLRAAALRLGVSHTHLAQLEQNALDRPPPLELLRKMGELYALDGREALHQAGYRYEMTDELVAAMRRTGEEDFAELMLCDEYRAANFEKEDLDLFPPSVWNHVVNLLRRVDASARRGGPTVADILQRARTTK